MRSCLGCFIGTLALSLTIARGAVPDPRAAREHAHQALEQVKLGNLQGAEDELRAAVLLNPENSVYLSDLASILRAERKLAEPVALYRKALAASPTNRIIRRNLALSLMDIGDQQSAIQELDRILRDDPGDAIALSAMATAYNLLGRVYWSQNQLNHAVEAYDQGIATYPSFEQNYLDLVRVLSAYNQWRPALEVARKSIKKFPNSAALYEFKGLAETMLLLTGEAIASYKRALEIDVHSAKANLGLAVAQRAAGMTQEAVAAFEQGIREFPQDALHRQEYGLLLVREGQTGDTAAQARGTALLRQAISMDPKLSEAQYQLGNILLGAGDARAALEHLELAAGQDPTRSKFRFALSRAYRRTGRPAEAAEAFREYERLKAEEEQSNPGFPAVHGQLP